MTYEITTTDSAATQKVAAKLAKLLSAGDVVELASDLGGGKTTFVQGLARAMGYAGPVTSPTFTLMQEYRLPDGSVLHHYDLYRLQQTGVVGAELAEDLRDSSVITVIEWAGLAEDELPADRLRVEFEVVAEDERKLRLIPGGPKSEKIVRGMN